MCKCQTESKDPCGDGFSFPRVKRDKPRFEFSKFDASSLAALAELRDHFQRLGRLIDGIGPSRPTSLAATKLEETYMWSVRAIGEAQQKENGG
jgi:hypothetical protein